MLNAPRPDKRNPAWRATFGQAVTVDNGDELAATLVTNYLFQKSQYGEPLDTPYSFSRHKIMHGEYTNYGKIEHVIRAFMILDFLSWL